jgi:recombination protein RecA
MANIVGDKSTGKTLLAIEAAANFAKKYPGHPIWYREIEAAFDRDYAGQLGLPLHAVDFGPPEGFFTVEDVFEDMNRQIAAKPAAGLYIVDSWDALSDRAELENPIDKGSFGAAKAKKASELFRRLNQHMSDANITIMIISQLRDKIGVTFGERHSRSGGHALDFYASQVLWLAHLGQIKKTRRGVQRAIGVNIKARCKKNKVGLPFREAEFPIEFYFGVNDLEASVNWLKEVKGLGKAGLDEDKAKKLIASAEEYSAEEYREYCKNLRRVVRSLWNDIDEGFLPKRRKYA